MQPDTEEPRVRRDDSPVRAAAPRAGAGRAPGLSPAGLPVAVAPAVPQSPVVAPEQERAAAEPATSAAVEPATGAPAEPAPDPAPTKTAARTKTPRTKTARTKTARAKAATAQAAPATAEAPPAPTTAEGPSPVPSVRRAAARSGRDRASGEVSGSPLFAPLEHRGQTAIEVVDLTKRFDGKAAVEGVSLSIPSGSFFGFVGPNGAGKTTTLAMITGMLRPDAGEVTIHGVDVWRNPSVAKRNLGVLPDRLRLFDRLTGVEYLHHAGALRGLDRETVMGRTADLAIAFGIEHSLDRYVADYSAGMIKKVAIAAAMIHSPRVLVLDEPFESVDPVSSAVIVDILKRYVEAGGTVLLSSHSMELIERVCDSVAIIVEGALLASGPMAEVVAGETLERRFVELAGGSGAVEGMEWLQSFSD